jgi:hypothetical protein
MVLFPALILLHRVLTVPSAAEDTWVLVPAATVVAHTVAEVMVEVHTSVVAHMVAEVMVEDHTSVVAHAVVEVMAEAATVVVGTSVDVAKAARLQL